MRTKVSSLREFEQRCRHAADAPQNAEAFMRIIAAAPDVLGMNQRALADRLEVSPASVTRYAQGKNAPHPTMRRVLCDLLADHARDMAREFQRLGQELELGTARGAISRGRSTPTSRRGPRIPALTSESGDATAIARGRDNR